MQSVGEIQVLKGCLTRHIHMVLKSEAVRAFLLERLKDIAEAETEARLRHIKLWIKKTILANFESTLKYFKKITDQLSPVY